MKKLLFLTVTLFLTACSDQPSGESNSTNQLQNPSPTPEPKVQTCLDHSLAIPEGYQISVCKDLVVADAQDAQAYENAPIAIDHFSQDYNESSNVLFMLYDASTKKTHVSGLIDHSKIESSYIASPVTFFDFSKPADGTMDIYFYSSTSNSKFKLRFYGDVLISTPENEGLSVENYSPWIVAPNGHWNYNPVGSMLIILTST